MVIECGYFEDCDFGYKCKVKDQTIPLDVKEVTFFGEHMDGKTNNDVKYITLSSCIILKVPQGLTKKFPNLEALKIENSGLKDINRSDLIEYKNFTYFNFNGNNIEYLPGDLFADCKKLTDILIDENPLVFVEPNILDGLEYLDFAYMEGKNVDYGYAKKLYRDHKELTELKSFFQSDETFKDFSINIDSKQFRVHKAYLAARSPTLAEMMRKTPQSTCLKLYDISVDIFEVILKFLYTVELPEETDYMQLFAATERLKIGDLKEYAAGKILEQLDYGKVPEVLSLSIKYNHDGMKQKAFETIKRKHPEIEFKEELLNKDEEIEKVVEHLKKMRDMEKELGSLADM